MNASSGQKTGGSGCARRGNFVLFNGCDWTAREELTLLEAIEHFGLGNWEDVSKVIGTRSPGEALLHYEESYVNSNIASHSMKDEQFGSVIDHTMVSNDQCESGSMSLMPSSRLPKESSTTEQQNQLAYLPLRDDFELDHDNTAEMDIADLNPFGDPGVYNVTTSSLEFDLKVAQIHMFRRRLRERHRRHAVVHEYSLVKSFFQSRSPDRTGQSNGTKNDAMSHSKVSSTSEDKRKQLDDTTNSASCQSVVKSPELDLDQFKVNLTPFLQTIYQKDCNSLLKNLFKEQQVKSQIASLQYFRKRGCCTLADCNDLVCDKSEDLPSFLIPFAKGIQNEVSNRPGRKFSSEAPPQRSCENGHYMLSNVEKKFCDTNEIDKELYVSVKFNVLKKIGDGMSMNEIKSKTVSRNSSTNVQTLIADFLQQSGLIYV